MSAPTLFRLDSRGHSTWLVACPACGTQYPLPAKEEDVHCTYRQGKDDPCPVTIPAADIREARASLQAREAAAMRGAA